MAGMRAEPRLPCTATSKIHLISLHFLRFIFSFFLFPTDSAGLQFALSYAMDRFISVSLARMSLRLYEADTGTSSSLLLHHSLFSTSPSRFPLFSFATKQGKSFGPSHEGAWLGRSQSFGNPSSSWLSVYYWSPEMNGSFPLSSREGFF